MFTFLWYPLSYFDNPFSVDKYVDYFMVFYKGILCVLQLLILCYVPYNAQPFSPSCLSLSLQLLVSQTNPLYKQYHNSSSRDYHYVLQNSYVNVKSEQISIVPQTYLSLSLNTACLIYCLLCQCPYWETSLFDLKISKKFKAIDSEQSCEKSFITQ